MKHKRHIAEERDRRIAKEAEGLWQAVHGKAPPPHLRGVELLNRLLEGLQAEGYERLNSPYLRRKDLTWPSRR